MMFRSKLLVVVAALVLATTAADPAVAQKQGGVLKIYFFDSPASMSIHEESTIAGQGPAMGVFNNLVMYDQQQPQTGLNSIVPDLASEWSWNEDGTHGSRSSCAKASSGMTANRSPQRREVHLRPAAGHRRPRSCASIRGRPWYRNLDAVDAQGRPRGYVRTEAGTTGLHCAAGVRLLRRSTPAMCRRAICASTRLAPGRSNSSNSSRTNTSRSTRNPDYWKKDRPYLDGIEWTIIKNQATGQLAFLSGKFDMTSPYFFQVPMLNDTQKQDPKAICKLVPTNVNRNVMINRAAPPFNNPDLRRAVALTRRSPGLHRHL